MGGEYRMKLGYLPQELGYYPGFTVWRYLEYLAELKAVPPQLAADRIGRLLQAVGLAKAGKEKIKTLSGGMVRRLGIAQSLLNDPEILILDELLLVWTLGNVSGSAIWSAFWGGTAWFFCLPIL